MKKILARLKDFFSPSRPGGFAQAYEVYTLSCVVFLALSLIGRKQVVLTWFHFAYYLFLYLMTRGAIAAGKRIAKRRRQKERDLMAERFRRNLQATEDPHFFVWLQRLHELGFGRNMIVTSDHMDKVIDFFLEGKTAEQAYVELKTHSPVASTMRDNINYN